MSRNANHRFQSLRSIVATGFTLAAVVGLPAAASQSGELDQSFGENGKVVASFGQLDVNGTDVAIQPDGAIVVVGQAEGPNDAGNGILIARFLPDGSLDTSFAKDGRAIEPKGRYCSGDAAVALRPSGGIVVASSCDSSSHRSTDPVVLRLLANGTPDPSFGNDGVARVRGRHRRTEINSIALGPNGTTLISGSTYKESNDRRPVLIRLTKQGRLDSSFARDGKVQGPRSFQDPRGLAVTKSGRAIFLGGSSHQNFAVLRYSRIGRRDRSFGHSGTVRIRFPVDQRASRDDSGAQALALTPDHRIVVVGSAGMHYHSDDEFENYLRFAAARLKMNGSLDSSFSSDGIRRVDAYLGSGQPTAKDLAVSSRGAITIAGPTSSGVGLVRLRENGGYARSFHDGCHTAPFTGPLGAYGLALDTRGRPLVVAAHDYESPFVTPDPGRAFSLLRVTPR